MPFFQTLDSITWNFCSMRNVGTGLSITYRRQRTFQSVLSFQHTKLHKIVSQFAQIFTLVLMLSLQKACVRRAFYPIENFSFVTRSFDFSEQFFYFHKGSVTFVYHSFHIFFSYRYRFRQFCKQNESM